MAYKSLTMVNKKPQIIAINSYVVIIYK